MNNSTIENAAVALVCMIRDELPKLDNWQDEDTAKIRLDDFTKSLLLILDPETFASQLEKEAREAAEKAKDKDKEEED